jgi:hypothetical protein
MRETILNTLQELRLDGMRMAYDEVIAAGQKQGHTAEKLLILICIKIYTNSGRKTILLSRR